MLASSVRQPLRASATLVSARRSFTSQAPSSTLFRVGTLAPCNVVGFPLTPLDDKYARFKQIVEQTVVPSRVRRGRVYPKTSPFIGNHLFLNVSRSVSGKDQETDNKIINALQSIRDDLAAVGPFKLSMGELSVLPKEKGNVPRDPSAIFQITLRPTLEQSERERANKIFRTIALTLYEAGIIKKNADIDPVFSAVCVSRYNTTFDITALVESLKEFGATDLSRLTEAGGSVNVDLGNFEVNEVILQKLLWVKIADPETKPLTSVKL
ncbi:hypothetical protein M422DRAFT_250624 [Sphaerobolus stellatus SS14]|uniref:Uncharacterized protein n=1 Tax=Sphaerobolus stellatus (strain SS14) TaxID=990650 RepID=A0A0C9VFT0_SPHS4|nr:hypothetical protein M422DRAFT_250624 [Sphaerobolus stellatus SS14]